MMLLIDINVLCLICLIFVSTFKCSCCYGIAIEVSFWDFNGRGTSLVFDGGSVEIYCRGIKISKPIEIRVAKDTSKSNFTKVATGNAIFVQRKLAINSTTLLNRYKCISGNEQSGTVEMSYALCSQRSIKPRKVCPESQEYCQITKTGAAECKPLNQRSCFLGLDRHKWAYLLVCIKGTKETQPYNLCNSLIFPNITCRFLTNDTNGCAIELNASVGYGNRKNLKQLYTAGWNFIDLIEPAFAYVSFKGSSFPMQLICAITFGRHNDTNFYQKNTSTTATITLPVPAKKVLEPTIANVICQGRLHNFNKTDIYYMTNLLLFRSDKDLTNKLIEIKPVTVSGKAAYRVTINVTAAEGLYVCASEGKTKCRPYNGSSNVQKLKVIVFHREREDNYTITFYVGLFASSHKIKYVLLYDKIFNRTVEVPKIDFATTQCSPWKAEFTVTIVVATILSITAMTVITVIVLWAMHKRDKKVTNRG